MSKLISPAQGVITSPFGPRNVKVGSKNHKGVDLARGPLQIEAPADGVVVTNTWNAARGWYVDVDHGQGVVTRHQHFAKKSPVAVGQNVVSGQTIGTMGKTGMVSGVHLHTEVIKDGAPIDPQAWYAARGVRLGTADVGTFSTTPPPAAYTPTTGGDVKAWQVRQNKYGGAGLVEDGSFGPRSRAWEAWVRDLQATLNKWKSANPDIAVTGDYDQTTQSRVVEFQDRNGLPITGVILDRDIAYMRRYGSKIADRPRTK